MIAGELHYLAEEAGRTLRAAAEVNAYAQEVERRAKTLLNDLEDLARRAHAQETQLAAVREDNATLRADLTRARATNQHPATRDGATMTRYSFDTANDAGTGQRWYVGWDPALASYFAQTEPLGGPGTTDQLRDVVAAERPGEIPHVSTLTARLRGQVTIPEPILDRLANDAPTDVARPVQAATERLADLELHQLAGLRQAGFPLPAGSPTPPPSSTIPNRARWQTGGYDDVGLGR